MPMASTCAPGMTIVTTTNDDRARRDILTRISCAGNIRARRGTRCVAVVLFKLN